MLIHLKLHHFCVRYCINQARINFSGFFTDFFHFQTFVRCTPKETEWIAKNPLLRTHLPEFLLTLTVIVGKSTVPNAVKCLRSCMLNFGKIIKVSFLNFLLKLKKN